MPRPEPLDSAADPRFAPYRDLRDRDARAEGHEGRFIAEGEVVLRVLLARAPERVRSVLLLDKRRGGLDDALGALGPEVPVYTAPEAGMSAVVGFPIHRGVLALASRGPSRARRELLAGLPASSLVVGVCGVTNHDNVGGIFRNAAAFGADAVLLDGASCDPLYRKAIRVSVGASIAVPFARGGAELDVARGLLEAGYAVFALTPRGELDVVALGPEDVPPRSALVVGAEGTGLAAETMALARGLRVTMAPGWDSLNVGVACGIGLHALRAARRG